MLEGSRLFFHSFIDAVLIGPESTVIRYTITPNEYGPPAGSYVHEIKLAQLQRPPHEGRRSNRDR